MELGEAQLRWMLDQLIQQGLPVAQASTYMAQLTGMWPYPGNSAIAEFATQAGADVNVGNRATITKNTPNVPLLFPTGQRASGNPVLNLTFDIESVDYDRSAVPGPPSTVYKFAVVGHAHFGAGGGGHSVDFDIKQGTQVSLIGQNPQISVEMEDPSDAASPTSIVVSASMGVGTRAARAFNTRTLPPRSVTPDLTLFAKVPKFAYAFIPFCDDPRALDPGATEIKFWGYAGSCAYATGGLYGVPPPPVLVTGELLLTLSGTDFAAARLSEGLKLPQGASLITITNNLPTAVTWTPCFPLSI